MPAPVSSSIQSFSQGWLGQFSSDPTLDGYGNAVIAGAQYYNNALNIIRIYNGTAWSNYNPGDASAAANSANLAQAYAIQASNAATSANASAANAAASLASIGTAVSQAGNSAAAAATSATAAAGSASTAVTSATNASNSATAAAGSASTANTSAISASTSATNSSNSATASASSAAAAANSATNASDSATNSSNSATASASSATSSASSVTAAAGSASSASISASSASTSATNASNSATSAAASAAMAAGVVGGVITIPLSNSNVTLTSVQFSNAIIIFTGTLTTNIIVTAPATSHVFIAENNTSGAFTVTIGMTGGSATVNVPQSKANSLFCDGSTGVYATSSVAGLQFSGTNQVTVSGTTLTSTYAGTRTVLATAGMTTTLPVGSTLQSGAAIYLDNQVNATNIIQVSGSDPIDTTSPFTMNPFDKILMSWDGTTWRTSLYSNYLSPIFQNSLGVAAGKITATNTATGAGLTIVGTGGVTPAKTISVVSGSLRILNNAASAILTLSDAGNLVSTGGIDSTAIGANSASTGAFTTLSASSTISGTGFSNYLASPPALGGTAPNTGKFTTVTLAGTGGVLLGDMSNVTLTSRVYAQTSITNGNTSFGILPNGSSTTATLTTYNNAIPTNSAALVHQITSSAATIGSIVNGTGTLLPLTFQMSGTEYGRLSIGGKWLFNTTTDDGTSAVQINGQLHLTQAGAGGGIEFGDGTIQTTANGTTAPVSTVYTPTTGSTQITTSGYTPGFIQVYQNGVRLVNGAGQDYTATDSVHINLTHASGAGDTYEVLTAVIYSPQTIGTSTEVVYTPTAGTSTFTVTTYTVGFIDVYLNGSKLIPGQDFTATTGNSVTLVGFTANGTDQFDVKAVTTYTPANALPQTGGTITGPLAYTGAASALVGFTGRLINVQIFSTVGTTTYTPTAGTGSIVVEVQGGGGAGGGAPVTGAGQFSGGAGGCAGGYAKSYLTSGFSGASVTIGAAGTGSVGASGGSGGNSAFGTVTANGGTGGTTIGPAAQFNANNSSNSGTATNGNILTFTGAVGTAAFSASGVVLGGIGAASPLGSGGYPTFNGTGNNATGFGTGGGGVTNQASTGTAFAGGSGTKGAVIVYEYSA